MNALVGDKLVDPEGIEPSPIPCERIVLPLVPRAQKNFIQNQPCDSYHDAFWRDDVQPFLSS
jgi:hypothetical protein